MISIITLDNQYKLKSFIKLTIILWNINYYGFPTSVYTTNLKHKTHFKFVQDLL